MRQLSVLVIHNTYQQLSGEDAVVRAEMEMLRRAGHRVIPFIRHNSSIAQFSPREKTRLVMSTTWDRRTYAQLRSLIRQLRPDIAHCHNLLPLISPAAYYACKSTGVPVVQTLHNYRLLCPAGTLYYNGRSCQDCTRNLLPGIARGCYRGSRWQTATVALMLAAHRVRKTWSNAVDAYIALSRFSRDQFARAGLPTNKIHVKPNFLAGDPGRRTGMGEYALFVGRLAPEKGVLEMLHAWQHLPDIPLVVIGDGPLRDKASQALRDSGNAHVRLLGHLDPQATRTHMAGARFLVFPSHWHEPFGLVLLEAAACGVPAIAARAGGVPELVVEGRSGLLFNPQERNDLIAKVNWAWTHSSEMAAMGCAAREFYEQRYTAQKNYQLLNQIYQSVIHNGSPVLCTGE
jgi:glycosyltransferase involved in cell wall biosynthesis